MHKQQLDMNNKRFLTIVSSFVIILIMAGCGREAVEESIDYYVTDFPQQNHCWFDSVALGEVNVITSQHQLETVFSCCEGNIPIIDFDSSTVFVVYSWGGCITQKNVLCSKTDNGFLIDIKLYEAECDAIVPWYAIVVISEKWCENTIVMLNVESIEL
jgi:hypothetical protein